MISQLNRDIKAILYERIRSPFYGAFLVSWLVWNWRVVYALVYWGDTKDNSRLLFLESMVSDKWDVWIFPFVGSVLAIGVLPFLTTLSFAVKLRFDHWNNRIKQKISSERLLTKQESRDILARLANAENYYFEELAKRAKRIDELEGQLVGGREEGPFQEDEINALLQWVLSLNERFEALQSISHFATRGYDDSVGLVELEVLRTLARRKLLFRVLETGNYQLTSLGREILSRANGAR